MASRDEDSRGARTLTDDSKGEGYNYLREAFITHRSASESAEEKKCDYRSRRALSRIPLVRMEFKHSIE